MTGRRRDVDREAAPAVWLWGRWRSPEGAARLRERDRERQRERRASIHHIAPEVWDDPGTTETGPTSACDADRTLADNPGLEGRRP